MESSSLAIEAIEAVTKIGKPESFVALDTFMRPLRELLSEDVTELCVNKPGEAWLETAKGWERRDVRGLGYEHLKQIANLAANASAQHISEKSPLLSCALPGGERMQVVTPPACSAGTVSLTIRRPSTCRFSLGDYDRAGFFDHVVVSRDGLRDYEVELQAMLRERRLRAFFELAVAKRLTVLVSGATGSGKTTFMKALVDAIPGAERLITIEDTPELSLVNQPNHVRLFYSKGGQGVAKLSSADLVGASMRMKPDRILPAELRDEAAYAFLEAANTGHPGSISSIHANTERAAVGRMVMLARKAPEAAAMSDTALRELVLDTIDVVVQVGRAGTLRAITGVYYDPERKAAIGHG